MDVAFNVGYFQRRRDGAPPRDLVECGKIVKNAGFDFVDFSAYNYALNDGWLEKTERIKAGFDDLGLTVHQTHAPYVFETCSEEDYRENMRRCFIANKIVGSEYIVVHADKYIPKGNYDPKAAITEIYDFYAPYVEYAKKEGFSVALESLFEPVRNGVRTRFTSTIEEHLEILEKFNDPSVVACWDFGHGKISNPKTYLDAIKALAPYLRCTHVHDNTTHFESDLHLPIYFGDTDWNAVIDCLDEIGYKGKFTYEVGYAVLPDPFVEDYAKLLYNMADYLVNRKGR